MSPLSRASERGPFVTSISPAVPSPSREPDDGETVEAWVADVELSTPVTDVRGRGRTGEAWLLIRLFGEPLDMLVVPVEEDVAPRDRILRAVQDAVTPRVRAALAGCDPALVDDVLAGRGCPPVTTAFVASQARAIVEGPEITVVLCTRDRPVDVVAVLDSLARQTYPHRRVLVVDNAPPDTRTRDVVLGRAPAERVEYEVEDRPGLSWARNRALEVVTTPVIAWIDDDEVADRHWLAALAAAFVEEPDVAAVGGAVVPAELRTRAQRWFESYGGHTKGRGFQPATLGVGGPGGEDPLFPLPPVGVGANMAFSTAWLRRVGGFDPALGAGTATHGGEDTLVFSLLLLARARIAYRPGAVTRHRHRLEEAALRRQMHGYGVGLTAFYAALLRRRPTLALRALRIVPRGLRQVRGRASATTIAVPADFPRDLLARKRRGMLSGPYAYLRATRHARTLARQGGGGWARP